MKHVAIVVLHFGDKKETLACLKSLESLFHKDIQVSVIVVDNDPSSELKLDNLEIIKTKENLGFAGGNNVGIRYALEIGADYIVILNNDTTVDPNLIKELGKTAESDEEIGIVAPKIYFAKGQEFHKDRYAEKEGGKVLWYAGGIIDWNNVIGSHLGVDQVDHGQYDKVTETMYASGCCLLIKREVLERIGLFDERYYLYYEDSDFSQRVKRKGYKILFCPQAVLWHKNAGAAGGSGSHLQDYYMTRNRLLFGMQYAPIRSKIALFRESVRLLFSGRIWQRQGVADFYQRRFGRGSYNL